MNIIEKYNGRANAINSLVCVGLDIDYRKLPARFDNETQPLLAFNQWLIDETHPYTAAYKLNVAFYEALGVEGVKQLKRTVDYLYDNHPDIIVIADAKRGDIGHTNQAYVRAIFDELGADAVTLHPYLGREALEPFLERDDKACIILCRTSNPGAGDLQDLLVEGQKPLWLHVAEQVTNVWNTRWNCMLVVGATYPDEMTRVRSVVGEMTLLVPGVGAQGGNVEAVIRAGINSAGKGLIVSSSRAIIYSDNPAQATRILRDEINRHRST